MSETFELYFVDFEASSLLPGSFPIELAWVDMQGVGESHLIKPAWNWLSDDHREWSDESAVHGIPLASLLQAGEPVEAVARRAADVLSRPGVISCSDAPTFEAYWMQMLLDAGMEQREVSFVNLQDILNDACQPLAALLPNTQLLSFNQSLQEVSRKAMDIVVAAIGTEDNRSGVRHRALPDAMSMWRTWRAVETGVAQAVS